MKKGLALLSLALLLPGCWGPVKEIGVSSSVGKELTQEQRFTLKNISDETVMLDQVLAQNKAVLVDFWATWCGYCVEEMPALIKLHQKNKDRGFTVLAVNVGDSKQQAAAFAKRMNIPFPILLDEDSHVAASYNVVGIPTSYLLSPKGAVLGEYHTYSRRMEDDVENALNKE